jgi:hypothetical protein
VIALSITANRIERKKNFFGRFVRMNQRIIAKIGLSYCIAGKYRAKEERILLSLPVPGSTGAIEQGLPIGIDACRIPPFFTRTPKLRNVDLFSIYFCRSCRCYACAWLSAAAILLCLH